MSEAGTCEPTFPACSRGDGTCWLGQKGHLKCTRGLESSEVGIPTSRGASRVLSGKLYQVRWAVSLDRAFRADMSHPSRHHLLEDVGRDEKQQSCSWFPTPREFTGEGGVLRISKE